MPIFSELSLAHGDCCYSGKRNSKEIDTRLGICFLCNISLESQAYLKYYCMTNGVNLVVAIK